MSQSFTRVSHVLRDLFTAEDGSPISLSGGVLVTLVHTEGSCYQKAGAQLFVTEERRVYGVVSGGCLEQAILEDAWETSRGLGHQLKVYETEGPDDLEFGFGMGCGGKLWVFMEYIENLSQLRAAVFGTKVKSPFMAVAIEGPFGLGERLEDDDGSPLSAEFARLGPKALSTLWSNGTQTYAIYRKPLQIELVLFGAGPGSWPVAAIAQQLGWTVTVYDHRPALLEDFPQQWAKRLLLDRSASQLAQRATAPLQAALLMTHSFSVDQAILESMVPRDWFYIGLMGSQKRLEKLWEQLKADCPLREDTSCLYGPAGLDIGGTDPSSIALQMCSEIQAVLYKKRTLHASLFVASRQSP